MILCLDDLQTSDLRESRVDRKVEVPKKHPKA